MHSFKKIIVWFRLDCDQNIGMGHAIRCLAIMEELSNCGIRCVVAHNVSSEQHLPNQLQKNYTTISISEERQLCTLLSSNNMPRPLMLVVDHYGSGRQNLSNQCFWGIKKALIDDFSIDPEANCDLFINPNISSPKVSDRCITLLGSGYAPIREKIKQHAGAWTHLEQNTIKFQCLISIGATDPLNFSSQILYVLSNMPQANKFKFVVVLTSSAPHISKVKQISSTLSHRLEIDIAVDPEDMGQLYLESYCCIGAAGSSAWERCCVGLPTAQLIVADNQLATQDELTKSGAIYPIPAPGTPDFSERISDFLSSAERCEGRFLSLAYNSKRIVDGFGANRIANAIAKTITT